MNQKPAIGRIVHYTFNKHDRDEIDAGHQLEEIGQSHTVPAMIVQVPDLCSACVGSGP